MQRYIQLILIVLLVIINAGVLVWVVKDTKTQKLAYIQTSKVFSEFKGTKELDKRLTKLQEEQKNVVDSLEVELKLLQTRLGNNQKDEKLMEQFQKKQQNYERLVYEFKRVSDEKQQQYLDQLWKQINQYVKEYGDEEGYEYIFGADGSGTLMYASEAEDLSEEIIAFINTKYEGG